MDNNKFGEELSEEEATSIALELIKLRSSDDNNLKQLGETALKYVQLIFLYLWSI